MSLFKNIKKLGLGIVAFEGTEHIYNIVKELEGLIDYTVIALQTISYHGDSIDKIDIDTCLSLLNDNIINSIEYIDTNFDTPARVLETEKRNKLIKILATNGCSHALIIDSDEFYSRSSFINAMKEIDDNDYNITYCLYMNYYHDYQHLVLYPFKEGMYVPFITKIKYHYDFDSCDINLPSDPTRRYYIPKDNDNKPIIDYHVFSWKTIKMHHFSWIRNDIRKKLNCWSSKKLFENHKEIIDKAVNSYINFDTTKEYQNVYLLFNNPNHLVTVKKLSKQYVKPIREILFYKNKQTI